MTRWIALWVFLCCALLGAPVLAATVAVLPFEGAKPETLQKRLSKRLAEGSVDLVSVEGVGAGAGALALARAGKAESVDLFVGGTTSVKKSGWTLVLVAYEGATGEALGERKVEAPWLPKLLKRLDEGGVAFVQERLAAIEAARTAAEEKAREQAAPEEPPAAPSAHQKDADEPEPEAPGAERGTRIVLRVAPALLMRRFAYSQDVNSNLRSYRHDGTAGMLLRGEWYPGAHFSHGGASQFGVVGAFERSLGATSQLQGAGDELTTVWLGWSAGARFRLPFSEHEAGLSTVYGHQGFRISGARDPAASSASGAPLERGLFPRVTYDFIRPGVDARFSLGDFALALGLGYRFVLGAGEIQEAAWFPRAKVTAADAALELGYAVASSLTLTLGCEVRRYGLDMRSRPSDVTAGRDVAGGARDDYLAASLGLGWALR